VFLVAPSVTLTGDSSNNTVTGGVLVGVGLAGMGRGIAMAVIGGEKVPVETPPALAPAPAVSFEPLLGPTRRARACGFDQRAVWSLSDPSVQVPQRWRASAARSGRPAGSSRARALGW
jgi:hypothetical protein